MKSLGVNELQAHLLSLLQELRETGETIELVEDGEAIARIVSVPKSSTKQERETTIRELDALAAQISANWPESVTALEAIHDVRRDL